MRKLDPWVVSQFDRLWSLEDIAAKIDAMTPAPAKRGPYKKREVE